MPQSLIPAPASALILWATRHRALAFTLAVGLAVLIALLDYATGYAWRFAILYLIPVALVTWAGGARYGLAIAAISSVFWLTSFRASHPYAGDAPFYWEGASMLLVAVTMTVWTVVNAQSEVTVKNVQVVNPVGVNTA